MFPCFFVTKVSKAYQVLTRFFEGYHLQMKWVGSANGFLQLKDESNVGLQSEIVLRLDASLKC